MSPHLRRSIGNVRREFHFFFLSFSKKWPGGVGSVLTLWKLGLGFGVGGGGVGGGCLLCFGGRGGSGPFFLSFMALLKWRVI